MAGGMKRSGAHGTLGDRLGLSGAGSAPPAPPAPPPTSPAASPASTPAASPGARVKHCWVVHPHHGRLPGLLLEWRSVDGAWRGRVVHPVLEHGAWVVVEEWLEAGLLEPAAGTGQG